MSLFLRDSLTPLLVIVLLGACSGSQTEAPPASAPSEPVPSAEAPPADAAPAPPEPAPAETAQAAPEPAPEGRSPDAQREVRYVAMSDGLKVEVDGVRFMTKAEAVRTQEGFHVRVTLSATAEEARSLLKPKNGPMAFAGAIKRAGKSEPEQFGDDRQGEGEEVLPAGTTVKISRDFPPKGVRPLGNGDSLELDVGLWGLGTGPNDRRAVKQFARVKASVASWKGKASIVPPPTVTGK
jgi:hypothetical protein